MSTDSSTLIYVSILSTGWSLADIPISTMTQGSFPLSNHAIATIAAILFYYLSYDIDMCLHNSQWFLIGQGRHPRHTIFIPHHHQWNACPTKPCYLTIDGDDPPLATRPHHNLKLEATHEAESSSDLARG